MESPSVYSNKASAGMYLCLVRLAALTESTVIAPRRAMTASLLLVYFIII